MSLRQWFWLVVLSLLWGGSFFFVGVAVDEVPTLTLVFIRVALAAAVLIPLVWLRGLALPASLQAWWPFIVMAVLNNIIPFSLIALGQSQIASGLAAVLNATTPLWTVVIARVSGADEHITPARLIGIACGIAGVAVLMGPALAAGEASSALGMACVIGGAVSYGCAGVWGRRLGGTPALIAATCQLISSSVILLPVVLLVDMPWQLAVPSAGTLAALVGLAVLSTAVAYIVFFHILHVSGATNVMLVTLLIPVSSIALGTLFLGETLAAQQVGGALMIAAALIVFDGRAVAWAWRRGRGAGVAGAASPKSEPGPQTDR